MIALLVLLLFAFLAGYFGIGIYAATTVGAQAASEATIQILNTPIPFTVAQMQAFLGAAILFLQFAIILFSMLDRIADVIRQIIRPLAMLIPLGAFLVAIWRTFYPIITYLIPFLDDGSGTSSASLAQAAADGSLTNDILFTLLTMLLFLLAARTLNSENAEIKALRTELAKYKRAMK